MDNTIADFTSRTGELIQLLKELIEIESPTVNKAAVNRVGEWVTRQLTNLGAQVFIDAQPDLGNHVIGRWGMDLNQKNVGFIEGGTATNVMPAEARAEIDLQIMTPEEAARIEERFHSLQPYLNGTSIEVCGGLNRPPMPRDSRMVATFQRAQQLAADLGMSLEEGGTGGDSDANFVAPLGIPVLDGLGAIGEGQHSEREHSLINRLAERAALLAALISLW